MLPANNIAFKEWAAICEALGAGRQALIIRKGGIHEGRDGFRVAHGEFWLFPTYVHEASTGLEPDGEPFLAQAEATRPAAGTLQLAHYAVVTDVFEVHDERRLAQLAGQHVWSPQTIGERFHYRRPGLYVLGVRAFVCRPVHIVPDSPHFTGCRSWVDLPDALSTTSLDPVLSDKEFERQRDRLRAALGRELGFA
ncbi:MAG: DUF1802 family protein [Planctomycetia bacterium]|nr:DUF1802 family protein [Planctomycetia bacterium]